MVRCAPFCQHRGGAAQHFDPARETFPSPDGNMMSSSAGVRTSGPPENKAPLRNVAHPEPRPFFRGFCALDKRMDGATGRNGTGTEEGFPGAGLAVCHPRCPNPSAILTWRLARDLHGSETEPDPWRCVRAAPEEWPSLPGGRPGRERSPRKKARCRRGSVPAPATSGVNSACVEASAFSPRMIHTPTEQVRSVS